MKYTILYLDPDENDAPLSEVALADIVIKGGTIIKDRYGNAHEIVERASGARTLREQGVGLETTTPPMRLSPVHSV